MTRRIKAVLKAKGVQPGPSKVYLIKWPVSVCVYIYIYIYPPEGNNALRAGVKIFSI